MDSQSKIVDARDLAGILKKLRKDGQSIVFTNGCFDLLHVGHIRYLTAAKNEGDLLVIGLNSDRSVTQIKGNRRPIISQSQRAEVLASLSIVDYVTLFDEPDPLQLIQLLKPTTIVKGADWKVGEIIGADYVKSRGGRVIRVPLVEGASTTEIIERIVKRFS
jgi:D-beta-D-heptose 7-phosphate kinase/D-beta-D-heptose 1-phosphate adenosyltransferase